jgi:hypothetical protein
MKEPHINNLLLALIIIVLMYGLMEIYRVKTNITVDVKYPEHVLKHQYQDHIVNPLTDYDRRALNDKLTPPLKRDEWNYPIIPVSTRGYPSRFKRMGILSDPLADNNDKFKFLLLIGRSTYPNSSKYDYYVTDNEKDSNIKFDLKDITKELITGDTVTIQQLGKTFNVDIDDNIGYDYDPYLF